MNRMKENTNLGTTVSDLENGVVLLCFIQWNRASVPFSHFHYISLNKNEAPSIKI